MKTLLIYMSDDMTTHNLSIHHQRTISDDESIDNVFVPKMGTYRDHFKGKHVAKMVMTIINVDDETGLSTIIHEEQLVHPLKPKIVINKPVGGVKRPTRTYVPSGFFSGPAPSAIAAFAAQQAALNAQQIVQEQMDAHTWAQLGTEAAGNV